MPKMNLYDFLWYKESSYGKNPNKMKTGGDYQIKRIAYEDAAQVDKKVASWTYDEVIKDPEKGRYVAKVLFEKKYPQYIKAYGLPDTIDSKIAMWNWGVGSLRDKGIGNAPDVTKKYIQDYHRLVEGNDKPLDVLNKATILTDNKMTFKDAFQKARREGKKVFMWRGKKYNTKMRGEK